MSEEQTIEHAIVRGDWDAVIEAATHWSQGGTTGPRAFFALNIVYLLKGEFALAWKMYAKSLQEEADIANVREWVDRLSQMYPEEGFVHLMHGMFLAQSGQSEQSITSYHKAIELAPDSPFPHFFLAQIYQRMSQTDKAIKAYRQAVKLDPAYAAARLNLGAAYQEHGQLEMAIPQYRELIKLAPGDALGYVNLACALAEQGKIDAAIREYKTAVQLNPEDFEVHY
ncbi:MAG: tetratricopeptide repeat protein, partial [Nitrospira sp. SB0666_bin_27]|nr:tetratricopeptide repeat protein [Nitrospira sp. SB0666_bin_27]